MRKTIDKAINILILFFCKQFNGFFCKFFVYKFLDFVVLF
jgi:hypothetical protein